jgi:hypothetical protein
MHVGFDHERYSTILFMDSMVALQGKPLSALPWQEIDAAGPILVLVVPQVMSEIDKRKRDGRLAKRARDPKVDGVVRWRRIDLKRVIEERFGVIYSERAVSDVLARLAFSTISGRPQHPGQDERGLEAFKKTSRARLPRT